MDSAEYANLARIEGEHWYYSGKRAAVRHWLERTGALGAERTLLDCGAGTGLFAKEMEGSCRVLVLDDHEEALRILRTRFPSDRILSLAGDRIPLPDASVDCITALDVLEHVKEDAAAVRGFHRILKPGGVIAVTVPAGMALWSDWDVALHHFRRYSRPELRTLFPAESWELVYLNYTNVLAYPAVWFLRRWRKWFPPSAGAERAEDRLPSPAVNNLLRAQFSGLAKSKFPFPFGVSLLLVARKL